MRKAEYSMWGLLSSDCACNMRVLAWEDGPRGDDECLARVPDAVRSLYLADPFAELIMPSDIGEHSLCSCIFVSACVQEPGYPLRTTCVRLLGTPTNVLLSTADPTGDVQYLAKYGVMGASADQYVAALIASAHAT